MPSLISHPAVPLALAAVLPREIISPGLVFLGVVCSTVPDLDVVGFRFGISYGHVLGHRGLSHSILFAAFLAGCLTLLFPLEVQLKASRWTVFAFLFLSALSHGLLDAMTSGGLGVAFFAPFDNARYFFSWRPIRLSPISVSAFFSPTSIRVLRSELQWIWLPLTNRFCCSDVPSPPLCLEVYRRAAPDTAAMWSFSPVSMTYMVSTKVR